MVSFPCEKIVKPGARDWIHLLEGAMFQQIFIGPVRKIMTRYKHLIFCTVHILMDMEGEQRP